MNTPGLLLVTILKALVEIAGLSLLAQGVLRVLAGPQNFIYQLFQAVTAPVIRLVRAITPRFIDAKYLGMVAFLLLLWLWVALIYAKLVICQTQHLACFPS